MCEIPKRNPGENVLWNLLWNVLALFIFGAHTFGWIYEIWGMDYLFGASVLTGDLLSLAPLFWDRATQKKYKQSDIPAWCCRNGFQMSRKVDLNILQTIYIDILETIRHPSIPCWHLISVMAIATCLVWRENTTGNPWCSPSDMGAEFPRFDDKGKVCRCSCRPNHLGLNLYLQPILSIPQRYSRSSQFHHQKSWFLLYSHSHPPHDESQRSCRLKPTCAPLTWRRRNSARWSYAKMGRQSTRPPLRRPS